MQGQVLLGEEDFIREKLFGIAPCTGIGTEAPETTIHHIESCKYDRMLRILVMNSVKITDLSARMDLKEYLQFKGPDYYASNALAQIGDSTAGDMLLVLPPK